MIVIKERTQLVGWGLSYEKNGLYLTLTHGYNYLVNVFQKQVKGGHETNSLHSVISIWTKINFGFIKIRE